MSLRSSRRLVPLRYTLRLTTPRPLVASFAAVMALGTLLLKLPASTQGGISWIDAFFVSVSAVSVTGLSTVDFPTTFTSFGGAMMIGLIQVGGLGIMTLATLGALVVGNRVGFRSILSLREELGTIDSPRNTLTLVGRIAAFTLVLELVGAVLLSVGFLRRGLGFGEGVFQGVFHAIMAFCNAGFATLPDGDLLPYAGDPLVVVTLSVLIILGALGFPVMTNLYRYRSMRRLTLHSKLVLVATVVLLALGVASVAVLEWTNPATLGGNPIGIRSLIALFQGVTPRTAGFSTVDYASMREPTLLLQTGLMFVGTAPTSTGGGVRITTLALLFLLIPSLVRGGGQVRAFGRALPQALIAKAFVVLALSTLLVVAGTLALMVSDGLSLLPVMFEVTSAFGTAGLSLGVTPELSPFGKTLIAAVMFLGRVGPITILVALAARQRPPLYKLPEEDIAVS